jgi:prepilin-type N-terminal cleavage/methylation domain-containing protein
MRPANNGGFTLLELLIAIAIVGVALTVSVPSINRYLESQRLRSISSEMLGDLQFARTEAVARGKPVGIKFDYAGDGSRTCYTVAAYTGTDCVFTGAGDPISNCNCETGGIGGACTAGNWVEIKTVVVPKSRAVDMRHMGAPGDRAIAFDPTSGNISYCQLNKGTLNPAPFRINVNGDTMGTLRTEVAPSGRPRTCRFSGTVPGVPPC